MIDRHSAFHLFKSLRCKLLDIVSAAQSVLAERTVRASLVSVAVDLSLAGIKGVLAAITGSLALAADAFHSLTDMVVSLSVLAGILIRQTRSYAGSGAKSPAPGPSVGNSIATTGQTASKGYWIEALVAGFVALLILSIPVEILSEVRGQTDQTIRYAWIGVLGILVCIAIGYFAARFKIMVGREAGSPALEADGHHSRVDVFTTLAVLLSLMGQFVGIDLDALVAVVIAVLIGITGIDLLLSAALSLIRHSSLQPVDLLDKMFEMINRWVGINSLNSLRRPNFAGLLTPRWVGMLILLASGGWLASGLTIVGPGETGVRQRFGKIVDAQLAPGLHFRLPAPFESIERVPTDRIYRVEVGFRTDPALTANVSSPLWNSGQNRPGYQRMEQESLMLTGDEGLVNLSMVVHYRPADAVTHRLRTGDIDAVLRGLAEAAARTVLAVTPSDQVLGEARPRLMLRIREQLAEQARRLQLGVDILAVHAHDLRPPAVVVSAFRDVFSAREVKAKLLTEAAADRDEALPKARAERVQLLAEAESKAIERRRYAEGDAGKFAQVAEAYRQSPEVTGYRLFITAVEASLKGKEKIVADPRVNGGEYRYWLFAPDQSPKPDRPHSRGSR